MAPLISVSSLSSQKNTHYSDGLGVQSRISRGQTLVNPIGCLWVSFLLWQLRTTIIKGFLRASSCVVSSTYMPVFKIPNAHPGWVLLSESYFSVLEEYRSKTARPYKSFIYIKFWEVITRISKMILLQPEQTILPSMPIWDTMGLVRRLDHSCE